MLIRIITGVVGIALAAFVIQTGGTLFAAFALVLMLLAWFEYVRAFAKRGHNLTFVLGLFALALIWGCGWLGNAEEMMAVTTVAVLLMLLLSVLLHGRVTFTDAALSVAGVLYFGMPFSHMVLLRMADGPQLATPIGPFEFGCAMIWIMFIGTWASDTFAYFVGSAIGSHKLCSTISPNKTIEGFGGSLVGTTAAVAGLGVFFGFPVPEMAVLGLVLSIFATLGDLVESVAKRETGIKDSGNLIPGHGGVWDRFDSVLFTAPIVYYFATLVLVNQ